MDNPESAALPDLGGLGGQESEETEESRRPRGRPRKDGMPPGTVVPQDQRIPRAKCREYRPDAKHPGMQPKAGFEWWNNLNEWAKSQLIPYVYRDHPVLKLRPDDPKNETEPGSNPNIEKLVGETFVDEGDVLRRYGCGDYRIRLNDDKGTITTIYLKGLGGGDYRSNPPNDPRINDIEQVDLDHPANRTYVAFLRGQGQLPEQSKRAEAEASMAEIKLVDRVLDQQEKLTKQVIEGNRTQSTGPNIAEVLQVADRIAEKYARAGTDPALLEEVRAMRADLVSKTQTAGMGATELLTVMMTLLDKFNRPAVSDNGLNEELRQLRIQQTQMLQQMLEGERQRVASLEARLEARISAPAPATNSISDSAAALRTMREVVDEFAGGARNPSEAVEDAARDLGPRWLRPFAPFIGPALQAITMALMNRGAAPGHVPAGFPTGPAPAAPVPSLPAPQPNPQTQPQPQGQPASSVPPQVQQLLMLIAYPLTERLHRADESGSDFATDFANMYGLPTFEQVIQFGEEQLLNAIYAFPPIATSIATVPRVRVQAFVREFVNAKFDEPAT